MCETCIEKKTEAELHTEAQAKALEWARAYAWDWFEYHAGQRTSMFNYGIAAAAILAAAYGSAFEKDAMVSCAIGLVGVLVCFSFLRLDARNKYLVDRGETMLRSVEATLFSQVVVGSGEFAKPDGILTKIFADAKSDRFVETVWKGKHRFHMGWVQFVFMLAFGVGAAVAYEKSKQPEVPDKVAQATTALATSVSTMATNVTALSTGLDKMAVAVEADARAREAAAKAQNAASQRPARSQGTK
jgi:hypothetical protein